MKRLCIFYRKSIEWEGKPVEWIVCKECQKKLVQGTHTALTKLVKIPETIKPNVVLKSIGTSFEEAAAAAARVADGPVQPRKLRMESLERGPI